jgi:hypothetical protein
MRGQTTFLKSNVLQSVISYCNTSSRLPFSLKIESVLLSLENAGYNVYPLYSAYNGLSFAITGARTAIPINKKRRYRQIRAILSFLN